MRENIKRARGSYCVCNRFEQQQYDKRYIIPLLPFLAFPSHYNISHVQLSKIKKTLSVGSEKMWRFERMYVRVCCHFIEKRVFFSCDFSFHPLLYEPECVDWNYFPRTENYIAHNCRLSSSRFILQTQKDFCCTVSK